MTLTKWLSAMAGIGRRCLSPVPVAGALLGFFGGAVLARGQGARPR